MNRPMISSSPRSAQNRSGLLVGDAMTPADIAVACYTTHLRESLPLDLSPWPALRAHVDRCEALPVFRQHYIPFDAPVPDIVDPA